jgi:hypothetical protein
MKLREAHEKALRDAEDGYSLDQYIAMYLASLEASGFCISPKEATEWMNSTGRKAIADARDDGIMLSPGDVFSAMLAARPTIED